MCMKILTVSITDDIFNKLCNASCDPINNGDIIKPRGRSSIVNEALSYYFNNIYNK